MNIKKRAQEIFDVTAEPVISTAASIVLTGVAGSIVPGVMGAVMNYRQLRSEKQVERFMLEVKQSLAAIDAKFEDLTEEQKKRAQEVCLPIALDYAAECKQEEKIKYIVNGFVNSTIEFDLTEDYILMFYGVLDQLSMLELRVALIYYRPGYIDEPGKDSARQVMEDYGFELGEYRIVQENLTRMGVLERRSQNDEKTDGIIENMQKALESATSGKGKVKPYKVIRISRSDHITYQLTKFGRRFLDFFNVMDN